MAKIKVTLNKANCISCGSCYASTPEAFTMDSDGTANVVESLREVEITDQAMIDKIKMARDLCPNQAIVVEEIAE